MGGAKGERRGNERKQGEERKQGNKKRRVDKKGRGEGRREEKWIERTGYKGRR